MGQASRGALSVAIIDDDPVETEILSILMDEVFDAVEVSSFATISEFVDRSRKRDFELVFLDRRLPPYSSFDETLPLVVPAAPHAAILLITAHTFERVNLSAYPNVAGPFAKLDLMTPEDLRALIDKHLHQ
ncbi:MAG TPA: hypothetical protein DF715_07850 [Oceanicaulis sp.]|jgi:DNA-binding NtrC family response regulator|uniref:Response regulatory domain-containing protein n=1 Tax=Glycocaulis albus TaxID=1382801 RepID=A0ABQ1XMD7_9PROT|nr:hypothetical protein [Glycocaulis albus]MBV5259897.1 response regulator [Synechococcus moorigangaii CMS01]GGG97601.1 hypothetical protein GCM10007420_11690 [Glycocaulis albus]HCY55423.1 hypothetical protein [Oceanicaulis sp.]